MCDVTMDPIPCDYCKAVMTDICPTCGHTRYLKPHHVSVLTYRDRTKPDGIVELDLCTPCYHQFFIDNGLAELDIDPTNEGRIVVAEDQLRSLCPSEFCEFVESRKPARRERRERI